MTKQRFLLSAGILSLGMSLASAPLAAEESGGAQEVDDAAIGTFTGLHSDYTQDAIVTRNFTANLPAITIAHDMDGRLVPASPELIVRDNIGVGGSVDSGNTQPSVVQMFRRDNTTGAVFFNCTGTLINPRTVLTAAHCVNSVSSEAYGTSATAANSILIGTGVDTAPRLFSTINTGATYAEGGVAQSSDVIIHPSSNLDNVDLPFPWADVAFIALDEPITDVPYAPILLSPLDQLTHVIVTGYGTNGTGDTGGTNAGGRFLRRVGENMLGAIATQADLIDNIFFGFFPSVTSLNQNTQALYFIDFDDPDRLSPGEDRCSFDGFGITCPTLQDVIEIDWFDGDALPQEAGTAPGDSGSPIIVDDLYAFPVVAGVLSGGYDFFRVGNRYSDISFYNPLYPFFEFITENTPYKYVSAVAGNGNWSDPTHWTQDLDPGFFVDDGSGTLVNGIPAGNETGVLTTGPHIGTILGNDISGAADTVNPNLPPIGPLPESSALLGPGSTGFVPNNTDGTPGVAFANPAQYFDVILNRTGVTTVDMNVEIDRLTVEGSGASFVLPTGFDFTSLIGVEQYSGFTVVDGTLNAGLVAVFGGQMEGNGTIDTTALFNVAGRIAPGRLNSFGTLTIDGSYVQTSAGTLWVNADARDGFARSDLLLVTGDASLDGNLVIRSRTDSVPEFGTVYTVLTAGSIIGEFASTQLVSRSTLLTANSSVEGNSVIVRVSARRITDVILGGSRMATNMRSVGASLDSLRFGGRYDDFKHLFSIIDGAGFESFGATLSSLAPVSAFGQSATATGFSQRFTGQIAQRTLALRGAGNAAAGFSPSGNAAFAQAGTQAAEPGKLGFFGSVSGTFLAMAETDFNSGATAFEQAAFSQAGELTLGADYKVSDGVSIGVAVTNIRNSANGIDGYAPLEDDSVAVAAYAAASMGQGFADAYFGYATQNYGVQRASQGDFVQAFRTALGSAEGTQTFAGLRVGYAMEPVRGLTVGPVASLDYVRSDLGGYQEYGAGQFGLNIHDRTFTSLGAKVGAMAAADMKVGRKGKLTAFGSVAYARELGDTEDLITASFVGAEDVPFLLSNGLDGDWVSVNAGAELSLSDRFSTKFSVTSDMGRGVLSNDQANVTLNWKF